MILSLAEYADNNDIDYDFDLLVALSWEGLKGTEAYKNTPLKQRRDDKLKDFCNDETQTACQ